MNTVSRAIAMASQAGFAPPALTLPTTNLLAAWDARSGITEISGRVSSWVATYGGYDATQGSPGSRPVLVSGALGGKPVVRFTRANVERLTVPLMADASTSQTVYVVMSSPTSAVANQIIWDTQSGRLYLMNLVSGLLRLHDGANRTIGNAVGGGVPSLSCTVLNGTTPLARHFKNGVADNVGIAYSPRAIGGNFCIGALAVSGTSPYEGDIAALFVYTAAHDASARAAVEAYCSQEWGIP